MSIEKFIQFIPIDDTSNYVTPNKKEFLSKFRVGYDVYVYYDEYLDGGGISIGQNYPRILELFYPNRVFDNCLEWCAGAGFIGFRLLADGTCNNLTLLDCYEPAINACKKTISRLPKKFEDKVLTVHASTIKELGQEYKFNLIVANPPHFCVTLWNGSFNYPDSGPNPWINKVERKHFNTISTDKNWQLHQEFFANIKKNLAPDGIILLQECTLGSSINEFKDFIDAGGLKITNAFREKQQHLFWYLELQHK